MGIRGKKEATRPGGGAEAEAASQQQQGLFLVVTLARERKDDRVQRGAMASPAKTCCHSATVCIR